MADAPDPAAARALAERVREACVAAALRGYEDAAMSGLCAEGALEVAISAIRMVDVEAIADEPANSTTDR